MGGGVDTRPRALCASDCVEHCGYLVHVALNAYLPERAP